MSTSDRWRLRNEQVIEEFRANEGRVGGPFEGAPLLLLHHVGARSGESRVSPMMYLPDGDRMIVIASAGGSDTHPAWYHNLKAHPDVSVEVGVRTVPVRAIELTGTERERLFREQASRYPGFATYEQRTDRVIPVIALEPRQTGG